MEPRIAGSVSTKRNRHPGKPPGDWACHCWNHTSTFPGPILFMTLKAPKSLIVKRRQILCHQLTCCRSRVETMFSLIDYFFACRPRLQS